MWDVLAGFLVVWLIIAVGFALGRFRILGSDARIVMSRTAFFVASPCLLFLTISGSPIGEVIGPQFGVAAVSAFAALFLFLLVGRVLLPGRRFSEHMIAAQSASQVNGANLGFPIAAYVLGDIALAAPVVMFQLAIYMPLVVATLDQARHRETGAASVRPTTRLAVLRRVLQTVANPVIIGAMLGLLFSWQQWRFPGPVHESIELLAGAAIPLLLLSFGLSLVGSHPLDKAAGRRRDVLLAAGTKLIIHPVLAYLAAAFLFGLEGAMLFTAVVMASLPTAQNVLVTAVRYEAGEIIARDTVLITTVLGIPSMVAVALLMA
ncbi:AEC family transporter [Nesterenkonia sp.]|uniref:AEC family transporter n=1 Tax=Nesterenkonia sp. TaxID=704201 RepID=UPI0026175681|nr:AEC family transporter [Nesterenkonia sp.]